jgi:hypothetical protein
VTDPIPQPDAKVIPLHPGDSATTVHAQEPSGRVHIYPLAEPITGPCLLMLPVDAEPGSAVGVYDVESRELVRTVEIMPEGEATL